MALGYNEERSDYELYLQFLNGDTASYDQLMIRYGDRLTFYLNGYIHDMYEAEDLMIEAFARIMAKKPSIKEGAFKSYLFKTARNLALRHQEKSRRVQMFSIDGFDTELADNILATGSATGLTAGTVSDMSPVEDELQQKEKKQVLHLCLDRIELELKEALWLIYFEGMSYAQAASVMGVKEKRIDRLLTRGKQHMRRELEKEGVVSAY